MKKLYINFILLVCFNVNSQNKRYLAYQNLNWDNNDRLDIIEKSAQNGFNAVELSVNWINVYPKSTSPANWGQIDRQVEKALSLNMKVAFRIIVNRQWQNIDGFWKVEEGSMRDNRGNYQREYWNTTSFSYTYRPAIDKAKIFITEVLERYKKHQLDGNVLFVTVVNQPTQELGFHTTNDYAEGDKFIGLYNTLFDYNKLNEDLYRTWLEKKYKKPEWYNFWNNKNVSSFSQAAPVSNRYDVNFTFYGQQGKDWYTYRHITLKNFIDEISQTVKKVNPSYKYINSFGSVCDKSSNIRGSLAFKDLGENTDGIKINDALDYDHRYTMDVVRANLPNKMLLNEIFPYAVVDKNDPNHSNKLEQQLTENYDHGASIITAVIEDVNYFTTLGPMFKRVASKYIGKPITPIKAVSNTKYFLSKAIDFNHYENYIYNEWKKEQDKFPGQIVDIFIEEDLLKDSKNFNPEVKFDNSTPVTPPVENNGSANITPVVRHNFSVQEIVMNREFVFLIPSDIFYDPDGYMTRVLFQNKPEWLNIVNGQVLQGKTPPDTGVYKINIRGYDNRGAFADAQYIIKVVAPNISFRIVEADYFESLDKLKTAAYLKNNLRVDNFDTEKLYNIMAFCNIDSVTMKLNLSGAYFQNRKSDYFPHSLFKDGAGFNPPLGDYLIYAEAYYKDKIVAKNQIKFNYYSSVPDVIAQPDWIVFPNPCNGILNVKLPKNLKIEESEYQIITETGQVFKNQFKNIKSDNRFESIDLLNLPAGKYFLKINTAEQIKSIPFLKL